MKQKRIPEDITNMLIELEDMSKRNNLRIDGMVETNYDSWKNCEEQFQKIVKQKLEIEKNIEINRFYRAGNKTKQQSE